LQKNKNNGLLEKRMLLRLRIEPAEGQHHDSQILERAGKIRLGGDKDA
jgi:hypothetical protein